jgi:chlorite dismutase
VIRQKYAKKMLGLLDEGYIILNVDQSWLNMMDFRHRKWVVKDQRNSLAFKQVKPRLSVLAAIDTQGSVYMALTMSITDSDVICLFLKELFDKIELERPDFRQNTVLLVDGAPYHRSDETHNFLCNTGV